MMPPLVPLLFALGLGYLLLRGMQPPTPPVLDPGYSYAFVVRATTGASPDDPSAMAMVGTLLFSSYALMVDTLTGDLADPTVWRGTGRYVGSVALKADDTPDIKILSMVKA